MLPWILNFMKGEYHNLSVNLSFNPIIFVVAGIFSAITVWVSIKKPFKIAATISPIEATRYYEKDNYCLSIDCHLGGDVLDPIIGPGSGERAGV